MLSFGIYYKESRQIRKYFEHRNDGWEVFWKFKVKHLLLPQ